VTITLRPSTAQQPVLKHGTAACTPRALCADMLLARATAVLPAPVDLAKDSTTAVSR
jgi:hypothetical protein